MTRTEPAPGWTDLSEEPCLLGRRRADAVGDDLALTARDEKQLPKLVGDEELARSVPADADDRRGDLGERSLFAVSQVNRHQLLPTDAAVGEGDEPMRV